MLPVCKEEGIRRCVPRRKLRLLCARAALPVRQRGAPGHAHPRGAQSRKKAARPAPSARRGQKSRARPRGAGPNRQGAFLFWPTSPPPPRFLPPYRRRCRCGAAKGPPGPACARPAACPGARPAAGKAHTAKTPGPGCRGWGFFFRQAGARLLCFPLCAVLHKKAKPTLPSAPNQNLPLWQVGALPWVSCSLLPQRREVCNPSTDTGLPMIG